MKITLMQPSTDSISWHTSTISLSPIFIQNYRMTSDPWYAKKIISIIRSSQDHRSRKTSHCSICLMMSDFNVEKIIL